MRAIDITSGKELAAHLEVAASLFSRAKGLLGRQALFPGEGLLIRPCSGVHTFFMNFPIDVLFLDKGNRVIEAVSNLQPYRISKVHPWSDGVIELPAGTVRASETVIGNRVLIQ
jgi:uncharacterized protein